MNFSSFLNTVFLSAALLGCLPASAQEGEEHYAKNTGTDRLYYDAVKARMKGDDALSESLLGQVIAANPRDPAPYYDLSRAALKNNDGDKAAEYINKAIALDSTHNKWYSEQLANVMVLKSNYAGAADVYAAIAKREHFNDDYLERAAAFYQRAGKYKEALAQLDVLRKRHADDDEVLIRQQQVYLKMNDVEGAARVARELINLNRSEPRYYSNLIDIYENDKKPDKAKEVLAEMQQKFPSEPSVQLALANQALRRGDTVAYNNYVRKMITNKDLDAETQLSLLGPYLGSLGSDSAQRREALLITEQLVAQHPENISILLAYARVLSFNNQRAQAVREYRKITMLAPNNYAAWEQLLYSYTGRQDADSLIEWSKKAIKLFPNAAMVHYLNGIGHYNKKDFPKAIQSINRAIDLEPDEKTEELSEMHTMLGDIYNTSKNYPASDSNYNAALQLNPRNATLLNNYAYYLSVRNTRLDDAERMSKESLKIRPGEATFLDTYGWILYQQGKYNDALSYIQKAVDSNPSEADPTLWEHLGAAQFRTGNKDAAVASWKKAKEKGSENKDIDKMIAERKLYE